MNKRGVHERIMNKRVLHDCGVNDCGVNECTLIYIRLQLSCPFPSCTPSPSIDYERRERDDALHGPEHDESRSQFIDPEHEREKQVENEREKEREKDREKCHRTS
eukprot:GHVU01111277.1.p1 GENE.GHVU01111277.1~~GHVU01111277.1.p1  ORF type:complete len:105 (+),score=9.12 GHVU01111277.1:246-560(+)